MILGTSMALTQARNRLSSGTPFAPPQIPNLVVGLWSKAGNCYTDNPPTVVATAGQSVATARAQFGTSVNATQDTLASRPAFQTDGLQFAGDGSQSMATASRILTAFTIYCAGSIDDTSATYPAYASSLTDALVGVYSGTLYLIDDAAGLQLQGQTPIGGQNLIRANADLAGNVSLISSGTAEVTNTAPGLTYTFNSIAYAGADLGTGNDSAANRYLLLLGIARSITLGSAEDLQIRTWIAANVGAAYVL